MIHQVAGIAVHFHRNTQEKDIFIQQQTNI